MPFVYPPKSVNILYDIQVCQHYREKLIHKFRQSTGITTSYSQVMLNEYLQSLLPPCKHVVGCVIVGTHISIRISLKELSVEQAEVYIKQVHRKLEKL